MIPHACLERCDVVTRTDNCCTRSCWAVRGGKMYLEVDRPKTRLSARTRLIGEMEDLTFSTNKLRMSCGYCSRLARACPWIGNGHGLSVGRRRGGEGVGTFGYVNVAIESKNILINKCADLMMPHRRGLRHFGNVYSKVADAQKASPVRIKSGGIATELFLTCLSHNLWAISPGNTSNLEGQNPR